MALTDIKVKSAKVPDGKKQVKLTDGRGMYLLVTPKGKYWRIDYRFEGKRKTLALGVYPDISLKDARDRRDEARKKLAHGVDPSLAKKAQRSSLANSFEAVALEWFHKQSTQWTTGHSNTVLRRLEKDVFPWIGGRLIDGIEPPDVLSVLRRIENRGAIETAHRIKSICGQVFRYSVATGRSRRDPTLDLRGALTPVKHTHLATITDPKKVGGLMRSIDGYEGAFVTRCALQFGPYVFVRPGELRHAEWIEFDLDEAEWRIPAHKMKVKEKHIVPLSKQAVIILRDLFSLTGRGRYVFPSVRTNTRPMSENTVNAALRRMGYSKEEICGHGFRAMASTILHEQGWSSDVIERQLAHREGNKVKAAYNHAQHLPERKKMMQVWADYLDALRHA